MPLRDPAVIAVSVRSGMVETEYRGHVVVVGPDGAVIRSWGDPDRAVYPRSSNKPAQAAAMVGLGLDLPPDLLALGAASHWGEPVQLDGVRRILAAAGLDETALQTPPDRPMDPAVRDEWVVEGRGPEPLAMTCSGKHAAMLATCVLQGWPLATYREPDHPLQQAIRAQVEELAGEPVAHTGVDGCGAPVLALTLAGLARSFSRVVQAAPGTPAARVAAAMVAHPENVGGTHAEVTAFMRAVPGLLAKDGALDVYAAALPDGTAVAVKAEEGSGATRRVALAAVLAGLGCDGPELEALRTLPVLGGGRPVGEVSSALA